MQLTHIQYRHTQFWWSKAVWEISIKILTDDGDSDGADLPSCELRTRIKLEISARDDDPLPLDRNKCEVW